MKLTFKRFKWQEYVLAGLAAAAFLMYFWNINGEGYSNAYYAAAVKSMITSPKAFFFGSFDSGLYVTVDKPPLGLMIQALSAMVFGVNSVGIILPSALAGVGCIILIYLMVKRPWGPTAGLIASGVMAFTPIVVAMSRTNNLDMILLFFMVLGAFFMLKAADRQSLPFYILAMVFLGLGFNVKMLEAYLALPAFIAVYFAAKGRVLKKIIHSIIAVAVLLVVSLSWALIVDSIPAHERPYVGGSGDNSEINLALGYNGLERLSGKEIYQDSINSRPGGQTQNNAVPSDLYNRGGGGFQTHDRNGQRIDNDYPPYGSGFYDYNRTQQNGPGHDGNGGGSFSGQIPGGFQPGNLGILGLAGGPGGEQESGKIGVFRLYTPQLSGLVSWFLLPALGMLVIAGAGFVCLIFRKKKVNSWTEDRRHKLTNIIFWSIWLLTMAVFYSIGNFIHRYYVTSLSPAIAALSGAAAVVAWNNKYSRWIVPVLFAASLAVQCLIAGATVWSWILIPMIAAGVIAILLFQFRKKALKALSAALMAAAVLIAPIAWSLTPVMYDISATIPGAGPSARDELKSGGTRVTVDPSLKTFLESNFNGERWAIAVPNAQDAEAIILETGLPVMAVNGFSGDNILTLEQLKKYVESGELKYYMSVGMFGSFNDINQWVSQNAAIITISPGVVVYDLSKKRLE